MSFLFLGEWRAPSTMLMADTATTKFEKLTHCHAIKFNPAMEEAGLVVVGAVVGSNEWSRCYVPCFDI